MRTNHRCPDIEKPRGGGTAALLLAVALVLGAGLAGALLLGYAAREAEAQTASDVGVLGWMRDDWGQTTVPEAAQSGMKDVAAGNIHSIALKEDGSVIAWGHNKWGQRDVPVEAQSGIKAISAGGGYHSLALTEGGSVVAWGKNDFGQTTVPETAQSGVKAISAGEFHNLAVKENGSVVAWGRNDYGEVTVPGAAQSGVKTVAAGGTFSLALKEDGSVIAWGEDDYSQTTVPGAAQSGVKAIAAGGSHSLALTEGGSVVAWGNKGTNRTNVPEKAKSGVKAIAAGWSHSLALKEDGSVVTWGYGNIGAWGGHLLKDSDVPSQARSGVTAVAAGFDFSLAVKEAYSVPPAAVGSFSATVDPAGKRLNLSWKNPTDADFGAVRVLRSTNGFYARGPAPDAEQTLVYEGTAESFTDTGLTNGTQYKYTAFATDGRNFSTWATAEGTPQDDSPPDTALADGGPSGVVATASAAFGFTSTEDGSTFECSLDGAAFEPCASGKTYENLDDGSHAFEVRATDVARNVDPTPVRREWTVDTGPPDTNLTSGPSGTTNIPTSTLQLSSTERGSTFECSLDDAPFAACDPETTLRDLGDGFYVFKARAVDAAGTTDPTPVRRTWSVDTVVPNTGIVEGPSGTVTSAAAAFEFLASEPGSTFECSLDGANFAGCDSPEELKDLSDGPHTFRVRATDAAGNADATPASRTWSVDANAPNAPEITSPADNSYDTDGSFAVSGTAEPGSTVELLKDTASKGKVIAGASGNWSVALSEVADGTHSYTARVADAAGNGSAASAPMRVIVDTGRPSVKPVKPARGAKNVAPGASVTATFSEAMNPETITTRNVRLVEAGTKRAVPAKVGYDPETDKTTLDPSSKLESGAKYVATVTIGARDLAGNPLSATKTWIFTVRR